MPSNLSNIINFNLGKTSFLFTGDAEQALGKAIKKVKPDLFKPIDFYQVPHHGSKNALDLSFYQPLQPKFCFIPSTYGPENSPWRKFMGAPSHQFPSGSVIDNLKSAGCQRVDVTGEPYPGLTPHQLKLIDHVNHTINVYFDHNGQILKTDYDQATILQSL